MGWDGVRVVVKNRWRGGCTQWWGSGGAGGLEWTWSLRLLFVSGAEDDAFTPSLHQHRLSRQAPMRSRPSNDGNHSAQPAPGARNWVQFSVIRGLPVGSLPETGYPLRGASTPLTARRIRHPQCRSGRLMAYTHLHSWLPSGRGFPCIADMQCTHGVSAELPNARPRRLGTWLLWRYIHFQG